MWLSRSSSHWSYNSLVPAPNPVWATLCTDVILYTGRMKRIKGIKIMMSAIQRFIRPGCCLDDDILSHRLRPKITLEAFVSATSTQCTPSVISDQLPRRYHASNLIADSPTRLNHIHSYLPRYNYLTFYNLNLHLETHPQSSFFSQAK